jgi:MSHA biogenesis protein MshL
MLRSFRIKFMPFFVLIPLALFFLNGCDLARNQLKHDRDRSAEFQDARDMFAPRLPEAETKNADAAGGKIPSLQSYMASDLTPSKSMPLVSISVNQSVPLRDILFELAEQADYDLELDPRITGSIIFTARERPFDVVIERIADIAGLRYSFENDVLRVELDTPYNKTYKVDYLSYVRQNKSSVRNNVSVGTGEGADTGSQYETSSSSEADFWGEMEQNLAQILGGSVSGALKTKKTPKITAAQQNPNVAATAAAGATGDAGPAGEQPVALAPQAVLNVESLPTDEEDSGADSAGGGAASSSEKSSNDFTFTINRQAGLLNVYASQKAHKEIESYLTILRRAVTAQVLIEAKVLEVTLDDEHATGIDWRALDAGRFTLNYITSGAPATLAGLSPSTFAQPSGLQRNQLSSLVVGYGTDDVEALIQAVSGYGTVKALASPRMTVLNNQSAVLNVSTNEVFFDVDIDVTDATSTSPRSVDISSDVRNVPVGILVNVQPSINLEKSTIDLALRPTVTSVSNRRRDPAVDFITASATPPITGVSSTVPELNVQEIDSVIQVRSGRPIVMGGLLKDRTVTSDEGVPVLSETPILGSLFKRHNDRIQKTELIIFLKATILPMPEDSVHDTDKDMYRSFSGDRRPLDF